MRRLYWTHLPAITLWLGFVIWFLVRLSEWPSRVALRIGGSGEVTSWGSPWMGFSMVVGLGILFIGLSAFLDVLWARQESQKRFNVLSLLDEFVVGLLVSIQGAFLLAAARGDERILFPWPVVVAVTCTALVIGILIEWKRPFRAKAEGMPAADHSVTAFQDHINSRVGGGERVVYWDIQNPRYVTWLSIGIPTILWVSAIFLARESLWAAGINCGIGLLLLMFYGGQRTRVSIDGIAIRYGLLGLPIFRCRLDEVEAMRIRTFAPLADFGGYGIRVATGITAYYLAGRSGVQLDLSTRRSALIGSQNPERLATAIQALSGGILTIGNEVKS